MVRVENTHLAMALRAGFELVNNGPSRLELQNTSTNQTWALQTNNSYGFLINQLGSGGNELSIRKTGLVTYLLQPHSAAEIAKRRTIQTQAVPKKTI